MRKPSRNQLTATLRQAIKYRTGVKRLTTSQVVEAEFNVFAARWFPRLESYKDVCDPPDYPSERFVLYIFYLEVDFRSFSDILIRRMVKLENFFDRFLWIAPLKSRTTSHLYLLSISSFESTSFLYLDKSMCTLYFTIFNSSSILKFWKRELASFFFEKYEFWKKEGKENWIFWLFSGRYIVFQDIVKIRCAREAHWVLGHHQADVAVDFSRCQPVVVTGGLRRSDCLARVNRIRSCWSLIIWVLV